MKVLWVTAVLALVGLAGAHGQSGQPSPRALDAAALAAELELSEQGTGQARRLVERLMGQTLESSQALAALLSQQKPERPLEAQVAAKVSQIQKEFSLKLRRFHLDLVDIAGEKQTEQLVTRIKAALPSVLLEAEPGPQASARPDPAASPARPQEIPLDGAMLGNIGPGIPGPAAGSTATGMGGDMMKMMNDMMGGMSGKASAPPPGETAAANGEMAGQLLATNSLITRMLAMLPALSAERSAVLQDQLLLIQEMLLHQAAMLQLLGGNAAGNGNGGGANAH